MIVIRLLLELVIMALVFQYVFYFWALSEQAMNKRQFWYMMIPFGWIFFLIGYAWDEYKNIK